MTGKLTAVPWHSDVPDRDQYETFDHWVDDMQFHNGSECDLKVARSDDGAFLECANCAVRVATLCTIQDHATAITRPLYGDVGAVGSGNYTRRETIAQMADRKRYHEQQIAKLDEEIERLKQEIRDARKVQGIHFKHLREGT